MRNLVVLSTLAAALISPLAASAQTIYEPVQYQYGRNGEIFYGGQNPDIASNPFLFMPEVAANRPLVDRFGVNPVIPYTPAIYPLVNRFNFANPSYRPRFYYGPFTPRRILFTDLSPYTEAGFYGFTEDDARNEAYFNAPRLIDMSQGRPPAPPAQSDARSTPTPADDLAPASTNAQKAAPLLAWAKDEDAHGHHAFAADLLKVAAHYDPTGAAALQAHLNHG